MFFVKIQFFFFFLFFFNANLLAQKDSSINNRAKKLVQKKEKINFWKIDTSKPYNPKITILRSAVAPGWGQYTNKKYWKMPIVIGALGTTAFVFFHDVKQFKSANKAYKNAIDGDTSNNYLIPQPYLTFVNYPNTIKTFRNQVRQNVDYSVLIFIALWGLNVVDAAVDAHLKTFDVNDNLSMYFKLGHSIQANTNGISFVLDIHNKKTNYYKDF